jgi:hypothetical protein
MIFAALFNTSQQTSRSTYGFFTGMQELGSTAGGTKLWSCTCESMARDDVPGMWESVWTSGQDAGRKDQGVLYLQYNNIRRGREQGGIHYTLNTTRFSTTHRCHCRMLCPRLHPSLQYDRIPQSQACPLHCREIQVQHPKGERGAWR